MNLGMHACMGIYVCKHIYITLYVIKIANI